MSEERETKEFEWYLRDYFFRQSNKGREEFDKDQLAEDMISLYLRYRNFTREKVNNMINPVVKNLMLRHVITNTNDNYTDNNDIYNNSTNNEVSIKLATQLTRLQCSTCYYISYLSKNEPRNCLRCSSNILHDFPNIKK